MIRRNIGARGSYSKQSRRELGKSSGKSSSGKSSSGKSSSGGSGSSSHSGPGWNTEDGSYCGCLCMSSYSTSEINNHGVSCDFTVDQNSYGYGKRNSNYIQENKFGDFQTYFQWSQWTNWQVAEDSIDDYLTSYGYANQDGQGYQGRSGMDDAYEYEGDDAGNEANNQANGEYDENNANQGETIVVSQSNSDYDPYMAFDVGNCDTYAHLWTYDLLVSCTDGDQYCECTYTEELMRMGLLSCSDEASCPDECGVCSNCVKSVCGQFVPSKLIATEIQNNAAISTVVLLGMTLLLSTLVIAVRRRRKNKSGKLEESLMDTIEKTWMVPVNEEDGLPNEKGETRKPVWLAPDVSTIPEKPLFPDLLKSTADEDTNASLGSHKTPSEKKTSSRKERVVELSPVVSEEPDSPRKHHPGLWLIPSSNASVPSSISTSDASGRSIGTMEGEI